MSILGLIGLIIAIIVIIFGFILGLKEIEAISKLYVITFSISICLMVALMNSPMKQFVGETIFMREDSKIVQQYEALANVYKQDFETEEEAKKYMVQYCDVAFVSNIDMGKYSDDASLQLIAVTESKGFLITLISFIIVFGFQMGVFQLLSATIQYEGSLLDRVSGALMGVSLSFAVLFLIVLIVGLVTLIVPAFKEFVQSDLFTGKTFSWLVRPFFEMYI